MPIRSAQRLAPAFVGLLVAAACGVTSLEGGGTPAATPPGESPETADARQAPAEGVLVDDDEEERARLPVQVTGSFLVACVWGDAVDERTVEVACGARETDGGRPAAGLAWRVENGSGEIVAAAEDPASGLPEGAVLFHVPASVTPTAIVVAERALPTMRQTSWSELAANLPGLADPATRACLVATGESSCLAEVLAPFSPEALAAALEQALAEIPVGVPVDAGEPAEPLARLMLHGRYEGKGATGSLATSVRFFCDGDGIRRLGKESEGRAGGRVVEELSLEPLDAAETCFESFPTSDAALAGAVRLDAALLAGPRGESGRPACYFLRLRGLAGVTKKGETRRFDEPTLVIVDAERLGGDDEDEEEAARLGARLAATIAPHRCP